MGVGSGEVAVELVTGSLGEELGTVAERLQVGGARFRHRSDWCGRRGGALVWGAEETDRSGEAIAGAIRLEFPDELAAVIGLPGQMRQIDATAIQVALALRREANARKSKPLRTSRAVY